MLRQVKASAGSGKTYELTRSYMEQLAKIKGNPDQMASAAAGILAVTFTNAAANEMRARVIKRLKLAALNSEDELLAADSAAKWLDVLLRDLSALNIRTIDSLLHQIVRASALELDLGPEYDTIFKTDKAMKPALDLLIDSASVDGPNRELLRNAFRKIVLDPKLTGFYGSRLIPYINMMLEACLQDKFSDLPDAGQLNALIEDLIQKLTEKAATLADTAKQLNISLNWSKLGCVKKILAGDIPEVMPAAANITDAEVALNKASKSRANEIESQLFDFISSCRKYYESVPKLIRAIGYLPFINLGLELVHIFETIQKEEASLPQAAVSFLACKVLGSETGVTDALCRLGSRLRYFLIDEFQDTSPDQWLALRALVKEAESRGGAFTWVGDIKQSIYSFRGGDPDLFDDILSDPELRAISPKVETHTLEKNWRSLPEIVTFNNRFFLPLADSAKAAGIFATMLGLPEDHRIIQEIAAKTAHVYNDIKQDIARQASDFNGYVEIEAPQEWAEIQDAVVGKIKERFLGGRKHAEMMVLVNSNDQAAQIAENLVLNDIPVLTENSLLLIQNPLIMACISFLQFMHDNFDEVALYALLNSLLVRDLLVKAGFSIEDFQEKAREKSLRECLYSDYPGVWSSLFISPSAIPLAPYDLMARWLIHIGAFERFPESNAILRSFMETIHQAEAQGIASVSGILEYWLEEGQEEKLPAPGKMDAVRVMTIHKAKGLEAPVVFVAGIAFPVKPSSRIFMDEVDGIKIPATYHADMGDSYKAELARKGLESLNMLYVAMTRPKEELYVFLSESKKNADMVAAVQELMALADLQEGQSFGALPELESMNTASKTGENCGFEPAMPRLNIYRNHIESGVLTPAERGTIVHASLERMDLSGKPQEEARIALAAAMRRCRVSVPEDARDGLIDALIWFARIPEAKGWFEQGLPEQPLLDADGDILRADLIVPEQNGPLVIDYKTGAADDAHICQVRRYMECIEQSGQFSGAPRGLLIYLDQRKFRKIDQNSYSPLVDVF